MDTEAKIRQALAEYLMDPTKLGLDPDLMFSHAASAPCLCMRTWEASF